MYDVIFKNGNVVDVKMNRSQSGYCSERWKNRRKLVIFQGTNVIDCTGKYITPWIH